MVKLVIGCFLARSFVKSIIKEIKKDRVIVVEYTEEDVTEKYSK